MDATKITLPQLAGVIAAIGTIVGAGFTVDSRYAKNSEIESVRRELRVSLDNLHKQILENEQLKQELGNNAQAAKLLAERNRQELADIRARLNQEVLVGKKAIRVAPPPPQRVIPDLPETVDQKTE